MKPYQERFVFKGEEVHFYFNETFYQFLILGEGICPIGENKSLSVWSMVKELLKTHYQKELSEIIAYQNINEPKLEKNNDKTRFIK